MKILRGESYALVRFDGPELELADIATAFTRLNALNCCAILDFQDTATDLSRTESLLIALKLQELDRLRFHKVGLLSNGACQSTLQIAEFARGRGLTVESFGELDSAAAWIRS